MISKREWWLMLQAYKAAAARAHNDTVEGCYNLDMEDGDDCFIDWYEDLCADGGVTVGDVLDKDCPYYT